MHVRDLVTRFCQINTCVTRNNKGNKAIREETMAYSRRASLTDIVFGIVSSIVVLALMYQAQDFAPRARLFPMAVLWVLLCAAVITACVGGWRLFRADSEPEAMDRSSLRLVVASALVAFGGVLLTWVGFYVTSLLMIVAVFVLHATLAEGHMPKAKVLLVGGAYAVVATGVMYLIFTVAIGLPAPSGTLF